MTEAQILDTSRSSIDSFFLRLGLTLQDQADCYTLLECLYPGRPTSPATCQGYCSMTIFVGTDVVVQFRPHQYQLDLRIADAACDVYGTLAPKTTLVTAIPSSGLLVYTMKRIMGTSYNEGCGMVSMEQTFTYRAILCRDFAAFLALSWQRRSHVAELPLGRIGESFVGRLKCLSTNLPVRFQPYADRLLPRLHDIQNLPWVLTHGDVIAANFVVDPADGRLQGLVDWAEAELLPFGMCFYGLDEILGELDPEGFRYYPGANELREIFWTELATSIPELNEETLEHVKLAMEFGILLWYGIAFDNGNINRVVQEGRDITEIQKLDAFLSASLENRGLDYELLSAYKTSFSEHVSKQP